MARFAAKCIDQMATLSKELEAALGPGTSDLKLRVGLNVSASIPPICNAHTKCVVLQSGPCTAGVLRGEKSRFQLFGDVR